jgi:hypothetical protein
MSLCRGHQETLRGLGDQRLGEIVERYVSAWQRKPMNSQLSPDPY